MTRTMDMMLTEPGMLIRRMFRDLDPLSEPRGWPFAGLRKPLADVPWMPELEMTERDHLLTVKVDLPGLKKENVAVSVTERGLVVEGERTHETQDKNNEWYTTERSYGRFYRLVPLPEGVKREAVTASFKEGVLEVTVPLPTVATTMTHVVAVDGEPKKKSVTVAA
jgi:HSP20 family protein